ncbi:hypothetical protein [Cyanobium sp. ATX-6F1]|uniref:hypothetical protein n=1 Tax=Cyanobium sp. ATX-6F1 TaxID=3137388 RepID=UPI0039BECC6A
MTAPEPASTRAPLPYATAYRLRLKERPLGTWLWALAQNVPAAGLAAQLYYAISRRTITPMIGASVGLLAGLGLAGIGYGALGHPSASLECLAFLDPLAPRTSWSARSVTACAAPCPITWADRPSMVQAWNGRSQG